MMTLSPTQPTVSTFPSTRTYCIAGTLDVLFLTTIAMVASIPSSLSARVALVAGGIGSATLISRIAFYALYPKKRSEPPPQEPPPRPLSPISIQSTEESTPIPPSPAPSISTVTTRAEIITTQHLGKVGGDRVFAFHRTLTDKEGDPLPIHPDDFYVALKPDADCDQLRAWLHMEDDLLPEMVVLPSTLFRGADARLTKEALSFQVEGRLVHMTLLSNTPAGDGEKSTCFEALVFLQLMNQRFLGFQLSNTSEDTNSAAVEEAHARYCETLQARGPYVRVLEGDEVEPPEIEASITLKSDGLFTLVPVDERERTLQLTDLWGQEITFRQNDFYFQVGLSLEEESHRNWGDPKSPLILPSSIFRTKDNTFCSGTVQFHYKGTCFRLHLRGTKIGEKEHSFGELLHFLELLNLLQPSKEAREDAALLEEMMQKYAALESENSCLRQLLKNAGVTVHPRGETRTQNADAEAPEIPSSPQQGRRASRSLSEDNHNGDYKPFCERVTSFPGNLFRLRRKKKS